MAFTVIAGSQRLELDNPNLIVRWKDPDLPLDDGVTLGDVLLECMRQIERIRGKPTEHDPRQKDFAFQLPEDAAAVFARYEREQLDAAFVHLSTAQRILAALDDA